MRNSRFAWKLTVTAAPLALVGAFACPVGATSGSVRLASASHTIAKVGSTGPIVVDSHGSGYVAWNGSAHDANGDPIMFCKIPSGGSCTKPQVLPLPAHAHWDSYDIVQPFPVLGGRSGTVLIVGPSYVYDDVVVWTSTDGGKVFAQPQVIPSRSYDDTTSVDDVLRAPNNATPADNFFVIAGHNVGLSYNYTGTGAIGAPDPPYGFKQNTSNVPGSVDDGTVGFSGNQAIEAFATAAKTPRVYFFWSPESGVSGSPGTLEHGPIAVSEGSSPRLAGGTKGLFLLTADAGSKHSKPLRLRVRKWNHKTHTFGSPTLLGTVPNEEDTSNIGGFTEDSNGTLVVAWPVYDSHGNYVMRLWTSTNSGRSFSAPTTVTTIGYAYAGPARLAAHGSKGFLTFQDNAGLEVVDLAHL